MGSPQGEAEFGQAVFPLKRQRQRSVIRFRLLPLDPDHSEDEKRFITFGLSANGRLLQISHTELGELIRIINARLATKQERKIYEEG